MPKERLIHDIEDTREKLTKTMRASFFSVLSIFFIAYIISCIDGILYLNSPITNSKPFENYSQGLILNEILGVWILAFTPITSFNDITSSWLEALPVFLGPTIFAAIILAIKTKSVKWTVIGGFFFMVWGILFALVFAYILPIFNLVSITSINGAIITAYGNVYVTFNPIYRWICDGLFSSVFVGWCVAGSIELGLAAMGIALIVSFIFDLFRLLKKRLKKNTI